MSMDRSSLRAVRVAKALADPTRYEILRRVAAAGEICCRDLVARFPVSQATASHHLKILTDAGLLAGRSAGQFTYFSLKPGALDLHAAALARAFGDRRKRPGEGRTRPRRGRVDDSRTTPRKERTT
jgi:ArsR family transcriptional regulator